jgi:hypothetical protein
MLSSWGGDLGAWIVEGEAPSATPVPTLNWQGIILLVTLMAGFSYYWRRKITS